MDSLIEKLMVSKKIMDKHKEIPRGNASEGNYNVNENAIIKPELDTFDVPQAKYNIPQELMGEQQITPRPINPSTLPAKDRIMGSKLPDEIKKLMLEHPIQQAQMPNNTLSDDLVEKASKLMYGNDRKKPVPASQQSQSNAPTYDRNDLKEMMRETFEELLKENGLLVETTSRSNETIQFKVGKTIFEGKITKVKKVR